jgi:hypothetical protein
MASNVERPLGKLVSLRRPRPDLVLRDGLVIFVLDGSRLRIGFTERPAHWRKRSRHAASEALHVARQICRSAAPSIGHHAGVDEAADSRWYAVRCLLHTRARESGSSDYYEERITLWQADSFDQAIERAEVEARAYASDSDRTKYIKLAQAYHLFGARPGDGSEVFSLLRDSPLSPDDYVRRFFDTGGEHQQ